MMPESFFSIPFFSGTDLEGYPEDSVFVSIREISSSQVKELVKAITNDLGIKPRFGLRAALDVLREDQLKRWPAQHELMIGFTTRHDGSTVFRTRAPEDGGSSIVSFEFFMNCVKRQKENAANIESNFAETSSAKRKGLSL